MKYAKQIVRILVWIVVIIFVILVGIVVWWNSGGNRAFFSKVLGPWAVGVQTFETKPITVEIGDYEYSVPANYFDMQPYTGCNASDMLLKALLPNYTGLTKGNLKDFRIGKNERKQTLILFQRAGNKYSPQKEFNIRFEVKIGTYNAWSTTPHYKRTENEFGLEKYETDKKGNDTIYTHKNKEKLLSYISCYPKTENKDRYPNCSHYIMHNNTHVKINYPLTQLLNWQEYENNLHAFIDRLTVRQVSAKQVPCNEPRY